MGNENKRPVYLNLLQIRLPIGGVVSILHRATGVVLTVLTPLLLYMLHSSLRDPDAFARYVNYFSTPLGRFNALLALWLFLQHLLSGVRHLLLDLDIGIARADARRSAWLTLALSAALVGTLGLLL
jgi:succinate dehydrogenase / fumarate reductase cytochrome b subunit